MSISPEKEIKDFGIKLGVPLVGIASVKDIDRFAPEGHRPDDFLIGAKSVIVFDFWPMASSNPVYIRTRKSLSIWPISTVLFVALLRTSQRKDRSASTGA